MMDTAHEHGPHLPGRILKSVNSISARNPDKTASRGWDYQLIDRGTKILVLTELVEVPWGDSSDGWQEILADGQKCFARAGDLQVGTNIISFVAAKLPQ